MKFHKINGLKGEITVPGDKSISHRAVMFGSIARGITEICGFLPGADCLSTIHCFRQMGISIHQSHSKVVIQGNGLHGLLAPSCVLDCGNSGTTTRLISGILAGQPFSVTLTGDASIQKRPMKRIMKPLSLMGANIVSLNDNERVPLLITGTQLKGIHYHSLIASAQVKSSILLAGLYAEGETKVTEPYTSRNHTELMLKNFGASVSVTNTTVCMESAEELFGQKISVPGDISSAAFFIAGGLLVPHSELLIKNVGINPTRNGMLRVCQQMGGKLSLMNVKTNGGETSADILVSTSSLKGITIGGAVIPSLIDELPIIALMACFAEGTTLIKDASELKVKESNRIEVMVKNLSAMGADAEETADGMIIHGGKPLHGTIIDTKLDHRIAMTFAVAGALADGETQLLGGDCVNISYPGFYQDWNQCTQN